MCAVDSAFNASPVAEGTFTIAVDSDGDGVSGSLDDCPTDVNPDQTDADGDALGDVWV